MSQNWKDFLLRSLMSIIGITFISFGSALSESMNMGLDPFTALNRGASTLLGFSLGNYQLVVNLLILAVVFFMQRSLIGWGTIYNMILVGYQVDFFTSMFENYFTADEIGLAFRIIITVIAILIFAMGVSMYMDTELGVSPYDAVAPLIENRTKWNFTPVRVGVDLIVVFVAFLLGGPVGISTAITGFFAGPLISFFSKRVSQPIMGKVEAVTE